MSNASNAKKEKILQKIKDIYFYEMLDLQKEIDNKKHLNFIWKCSHSRTLKSISIAKILQDQNWQERMKTSLESEEIILKEQEVEIQKMEKDLKVLQTKLDKNIDIWKNVN